MIIVSNGMQFMDLHDAMCCKCRKEKRCAVLRRLMLDNTGEVKEWHWRNGGKQVSCDVFVRIGAPYKKQECDTMNLFEGV